MVNIIDNSFHLASSHVPIGRVCKPSYSRVPTSPSSSDRRATSRSEIPREISLEYEALRVIVFDQFPDLRAADLKRRNIGHASKRTEGLSVNEKYNDYADSIPIINAE